MKTFMTGLVLTVFLGSSLVWAAKPKAQKHWNQVGKKAHARVARQNMKQKNKSCAAACRKAGARKATDLGACREGCVFG